MAKFNFAFAAAVAAQSGLGTVNGTLAVLSGAVASKDGLVLGRPTGLGNSGFSFKEKRNLLENADVAGSFTKVASQFVREEVSDFGLEMYLKGAAQTLGATPVDGDFSYTGGTPARAPGIDAILQSGGLIGGAWGTGVGWQYGTGAAIPCTIKVWVGAGTSCQAWVLMDCFCDWEMDLTPGSIGILKPKFSVGSVWGYNITESFPTVDYGTQASVSAPVVQSVANAWGLAGALRGFSALKIKCKNSLSTIPDSNATGGGTIGQDDREITVEASIFADSAGEGFARANLVNTVAPTDDMAFQVGATGVTGQPGLAYAIAANNLEVQEYNPDAAGVSQIDVVKARCTGAAANTEFSMTLL